MVRILLVVGLTWCLCSPPTNRIRSPVNINGLLLVYITHMYARSTLFHEGPDLSSSI